ncbi:MAG: PorT family protein [Gemmatimonadaceae bacterium]|nr:PorT family protein [Gemmatimonadaceae bacterium]
MLVLVAGSPSRSNAQEYGVMLGYSYSGFPYPDSHGQSGRLRRAIPVGVFARQSLSHALSIEEDVAFVTKGEGAGPGVLARYLEAPLLVEFAVAKPRSAASYGRPYLLAGPSVALRLSCELTEPGLFGTTGCKTWIKDYGLRRFDAGVVTGFGLEFGKERRPRQQLELRYTRGIMDIGRAEHTRSHVVTVWFKATLPRQAP